nr:MAG TPA: hypothetical protein [Caudoviricetes sp.]
MQYGEGCKNPHGRPCVGSAGTVFLLIKFLSN